MLTSTQRLIETNGVQLRVTEAGERGAPLVVLAHGFPELAYSWRHQIPALAEAGFHVLAPDQRGYGGSSKPEVVEAYTVVELCADLVGLLDDVGAERAAIIGHDFGAVVAWAAPLLHPDRFAGVAGLSLPPVPRPRVPTTQAFRKVFGDNFFYILYFQEAGPADAELDRDPTTTLRKLMGGIGAGADEAAGLRMLAPGPEGFIERIPDPGGLPGWLSQARVRPLRATNSAATASPRRSTGTAASTETGHSPRRRRPPPSPCRRCSSAVAPTRRWPTRPVIASVRSSPATTAK